MIPQGSSLIDTGYFSSLTAQVNAIQGTTACADLQAVIDKAAASIAAELASVRAQVAALLPVITMPGANPGAIVAWITKFMAPSLQAYANLIATEAALASAIGDLESAVSAAAGRLAGCSVTIPPMT